MEQESLVAAVQHAVYELSSSFVRGAGRETHGLAALENGTSVGHGQCRHLAQIGRMSVVARPSRRNPSSRDAATHGVTEHVLIVTAAKPCFSSKLISGEIGMGGIVFLDKVGQYLVKSIMATCFSKA
jgi:hypothetical protein